MKALIDYDGAGTLVANTKTLIANSIAVHNTDLTAHGGASAVDVNAFTDTFVVQVTAQKFFRRMISPTLTKTRLTT